MNSDCCHIAKETGHLLGNGEGGHQTNTPRTLFPSSLPRLGNKGMSTTYAIFTGLFGLFLFSISYLILDQVMMGEFWDFAIQWNVNGTYLNLFKWLFEALPIVVSVTFMIGAIVVAHMTKNE